jgi:hypothetical protein
LSSAPMKFWSPWKTSWINSLYFLWTANILSTNWIWTCRNNRPYNIIKYNTVKYWYFPIHIQQTSINYHVSNHTAYCHTLKFKCSSSQTFNSTSAEQLCQFWLLYLNMHFDSISSCGLLEDSLVHISMWQTISHKK